MSPGDRPALLPPRPTLLGLPVVLPVPREPAAPPAMPLRRTPPLERTLSFPFGAVVHGLPAVLLVTVQARGGDACVRMRRRGGGDVVRLEELCDADVCDLGRRVANSLRVVEGEVVS